MLDREERKLREDFFVILCPLCVFALNSDWENTPSLSSYLRLPPRTPMKIRLLVAALLTTPALLLSAEVTTLTPTEAAARVAAGKAVLIDVREPAEWAETGVAAPAVLLPMSDFNGDQKLWKPFLTKNAGKELILYCRSGNRSGQVAAKLAAAGQPVANAGAFKDWAAAGLPTRPGGK